MAAEQLASIRYRVHGLLYEQHEVDHVEVWYGNKLLYPVTEGGSMETVTDADAGGHTLTADCSPVTEEVAQVVRDYLHIRNAGDDGLALELLKLAYQRREQVEGLRYSREQAHTWTAVQPPTDVAHDP